MDETIPPPPAGDSVPRSAWVVPGVTDSVGSADLPDRVEGPQRPPWSADHVLVGVSHEVVDGLTLIEAGVASGLAGYTHDTTLTAEQLRALVLRWTRVTPMLEAVRLAAVRASVAREPAGRSQGKLTRAVLEEECRRGASAAKSDLKTAALLDPDTGDLRQLGAALAAGEVSAEHVRNARTALSRLPSRLVRAKGREIDEAFTRNASEWSPYQAQILNTALVDVLAPAQAERDPADDYIRRGVQLATDAFGMLLIRGQLDATSGDLVTAVLDHLMIMDRPDTHDLRPGETADQPPGDPGVPGEESVADVRDIAQRRADAFVLMAQLAAEYLSVIVDDDGLPATTGIGGKLNQRSSRTVPHVSVQVSAETDDDGSGQPADAEPTGGCTCRCAEHTPCSTPTDDAAASGHSDSDQTSTDQTSTDQTSTAKPADPTCSVPGQQRRRPTRLTGLTVNGRPISQAMLELLICDSVLEQLSMRQGRVVALHSKSRVATPAQTAAVIARDHACVFPGCAAPPSLCQVHHVRFWSRGGPTHIDNLALLCWRHHQLIHQHATTNPDDGWQLVMLNGIPHAIRPIWLDPERLPIRNTLIDRISETRRAARQLIASSNAAQPP